MTEKRGEEKMKIWEVELQDGKYGEDSLPLETVHVVAVNADEAISKAIKYENKQQDGQVDVVVSVVRFTCKVDVP